MDIAAIAGMGMESLLGPVSAPVSALGGVDFGPAALLDLSSGSTSPAAESALTILGARYGGPAPLPAAVQSREDARRQRSIVAASTALLAKDYAGARAAALELLKRNGDDAAANHLLARATLGEGDTRSAIRYFARAAQLEPDNARYASDLRNAQFLERSDEAALSAARGMLKDPGQRASGLRLLYELADRSRSFTTLTALGDEFMKLKARQQAVGAYATALDLAREPQLGELLERARAVVQDSPDAAVAHRLVAEVLRRMGRHDEALVSLRRASELAPDDPQYLIDIAETYNARGEANLAADRLLAARDDFAQARQLRPVHDPYLRNTAETFTRLGQQWMARGALRSALADLNSARAFLPADGADDLLRRLAGLFYALGNRYGGDDRKTALSAMQAAYDLNGTLTHKRGLADAHNALGLEYMDEGEYASAVEQFEAALALFADDERYADNLADAESRLGEGQ